METPTSGNIATKTTKKSKTNLKGFTKVPNSILNNKTLSLEEKGLLSILISNSKEWKVFITEIYKRSTNSELIQRAIYNKLIAKNYAKRVRTKNEKGQIQWSFELNPYSDLPSMAEPSMAEPSMAEPSMVNRGINKTNLNNINLNKTNINNINLNKKIEIPEFEVEIKKEEPVELIEKEILTPEQISEKRAEKFFAGFIEKHTRETIDALETKLPLFNEIKSYIDKSNTINSTDKSILTKRVNKHIYNSAEKKELVQENKYTITKKEPAIENNVIRTEEYIWNEVTTQNPPEIISSLSFVERNILFNKIIFDIETKETRLNTNERQTIIADIKVYFNLNSTEGEVILIQ